MRKIIMKLLGIEKLSNIKIPVKFLEHPPKAEKMWRRKCYYIIHQKVKVPIIINRDNVLLDGYTSYLIEKILNKKYVKVIRV